MANEIQTRITVQVQPGASRSQVKDFKEGILYIRIAAPPVEGKANRELIEFLSEILEVSKSRITIEKGLTGKKKVVLITGLTQERVTGMAMQKKK